MKQRTLMIFLATLFLAFSATAAGGKIKMLQCDFQDNMFAYRDLFKISSSGKATYLLSMAQVGTNAFKKACSADQMTVTVAGDQMTLAGDVTCVDGNTAHVTQILNLTTMQIDGTWKGPYPCKWLK